MAHVDSHGPKSIRLFNMPIVQTTSPPPAASDTQLLPETKASSSPEPLGGWAEKTIWRGPVVADAEIICREYKSGRDEGMIHSVFWHRMRKDDTCILKEKLLPDRLEEGEKGATEDAMCRRNDVHRHRGI